MIRHVLMNLADALFWIAVIVAALLIHDAIKDSRPYKPPHGLAMVQGVLG